MRVFCILFVVLLFACSCEAQSDLLILKKNNRTAESFFPGSEMNFSTGTRSYDAYVTSIEKDSVFLVQYDVRRAYTNLGVFILDTVAQYHFGVNYHDIISFGKKRSGFDWNASGAGLFGGGVLLTTAGLITWIFAKPNTRYYARPQLVIGAAAIAGIGYLLMKSGDKTRKLGKKYTLHYIKVK
jgi:hypothetical protein